MSETQVGDFFNDESILVDPYSYYEYVRGQGPVWREPYHGGFVVTGYEEMGAIYRDTDTYSSCNSFAGPFVEFPEPPSGDDIGELIEKYRGTFANGESFITWDPPVHTAHRALMMRLLTPKRLKENEEFMWRLADRQIDDFIASGKCEFLADYARPLALLVIADLLGVPEEDHVALRQGFANNGLPGALGQVNEGVNFLSFLEDKFTGYIEDRRANPRDDVLTHMALGQFPDGTTPEVTDVARVATLLFAGGQGTVARFLGNMLKLIAEEPGLQRLLGDERARIPQFVEEMLRFNSPVKVNFRMTRVSTSLAGVDIPAGSTLIMLLGAADRDARRFGCPFEFDIDRANAREHVAFGRGVHSCPGGPLVRAEGRITAERMLARLSDIRLDVAEHGTAEDRRFQYTPTYILRGVEALHLEFTAR